MFFSNLVKNSNLKNGDPVFQSLQDWKHSLDNIADMITIHDREFNIIYANRAAEKALGLPQELKEGMKCFKYYHGTDIPPDRCPTCQCLKTQKSSVYEMFEPHLKKFLEIRTIPRFDHNKLLDGLIHVVRDVTDHKKTISEKLKLETELLHSHKLQTVETLTGGAIHDFNNFLTAIIGYSELLQTDVQQSSPDAFFYAEQIIHAAKKASSLTRDILSFSRKKAIAPKLLNVNETARQAIKLLAILLSKNIRLNTIFSEDELMVMADSGQIEQILMNLAINARDAMPDGGILSIKTSPVDMDTEFLKKHGYGKPGKYVMISVSDNGTGMDKNTREKIFEPFFTTKETGKGTGLGLPIVYGIVKQYGGYIDVQSEPGKGTTFGIYLPASINPAEGIRLTSTDPILTVNTGTVLVLDESSEVKSLITEVLAGYGYNVIGALDEEGAIALLTKNREPVDLLLTDRVIQWTSSNPGIKVLYTNECGINGQDIKFITKPFLPQDLLKAVREMI